MSRLAALFIVIVGCGGTAAESPRDASADRVATDAGSGAPSLDAQPDAGPVVCILAGAGFECSPDGGAFETSVDGGWASCDAMPCTPGTRCRAGAVEGVCVQR